MDYKFFYVVWYTIQIVCHHFYEYFSCKVFIIKTIFRRIDRIDILYIHYKNLKNKDGSKSVSNFNIWKHHIYVSFNKTLHKHKILPHHSIDFIASWTNCWKQYTKPFQYLSRVDVIIIGIYTIHTYIICLTQNALSVTPKSLLSKEQVTHDSGTIKVTIILLIRLKMRTQSFQTPTRTTYPFDFQSLTNSRPTVIKKCSI